MPPSVKIGAGGGSRAVRRRRKVGHVTAAPQDPSTRPLLDQMKHNRHKEWLKLCHEACGSVHFARK